MPPDLEVPHSSPTPTSPAQTALSAAAQPGPLCVLKVSELPAQPSDHPPWLIEDLWTHQAVGLIGGPPKICKTFLALEMALAVASGTPCLGRFPVHNPGPVLLFAAEDAPPQVHDRLLGLARARRVDFHQLPIFLILADQLRLDHPQDQARLTDAIELHQPRMLILDPFVRLHRLQENSATEVSALLADLRTLQRRFDLAILLVHHTRKAGGLVSGQTLRGSSDLHAWGDSNLYLKRTHDLIRLTAEHRCARAPDPITLALTGDPARLKLTTAQPQTTDLYHQILDALTQHPAPMTQPQLRATLKVRNQSLTTALRTLHHQNKITRLNGGWTLPTPNPPQQPSLFSNSTP